MEKLKLRFNFVLFFISLLLAVLMLNKIETFNGLFILYYFNTYVLLKNAKIIFEKLERR
jgi:hypothetical protein